MVQAVNKLGECHSTVQFQLQNSSYQFLIYNFSLRCEPFQTQLHLCVCVCLCLSVYRLLLFAQCGSQVNWTTAGQLGGLIHLTELHQPLDTKLYTRFNAFSVTDF